MGDTIISIPYNISIYLNGKEVEVLKEIETFSIKVETFEE